MRHTRMLLFIVGLMKVLGLFPYRLDRQSSTTTLSGPLLMYSILMTATIWAVCIIIHVTILPTLVLEMFGTQFVVFCLSIFAINASIFILPLLLLRSQKLARALASLLQFHDEQLCHLTENNLNIRAVFQLLLILFSVIISLSIGILVNFHYHWLLAFSSAISIFYDTPLRFLVPVFHHAVFRLVSVLLGAAFVPLTNEIENSIREGSFQDGDKQPLVETVLWNENTMKGVPPPDTSNHIHIITEYGEINKGQEDTRMFSRSAAHREHTLRKPSTPFLRREADALLSARRSMILIEEVEATVSDLLAPLICTLLLSECILNITSLMSLDLLQIRQLLLYSFYTVLAVVKSYLLLDAPNDYHRKVSQVAGVRVKKLLKQFNIHSQTLHICTSFFISKLVSQQMNIRRITNPDST